MTGALFEKLKEKRMNQKKLAEAIGMSYTVLNRKLNGRLPLLYSEAIEICKVLGVDNPIPYFDVKRK
jgi:transcriptional regulator with XRE-family HTH domain